MATDVVSDVTQERLLARTLVELREVVTRARMMLPALSLHDLLMLAGAVEQAKTEGMKLRPKREDKPPIEEPEVMQPVLAVPLVKKPKSLMVHTDKGEDLTVVDAVKSVLSRNGSKTVREILDAFEVRGWKLITTSPYPTQILRMYLERNDDVFQRTSRKEGDKPVARFSRKEVKAKATKDVKAKEPKGHPRAAKVYIGDQIIRTLASLTKPVSTADLAKKINVERIQSLIPLLVSLRTYGAIKDTQKDGTHHWFPVIEKLRKYDAEHKGTAFFSKEDAKALNGVSHA